MSKNLYLIRHGHSLHNELYHKIGVNAFRHPEMIDSPLTNEGNIQSIELGYSWTDKHKIELVIVSPLTRALETCMNIFGDTEIPIECYEFLREYPIGEHTCNKRSSLTNIKNKFPKINFNLDIDIDTLWENDRRETINELEQRIEMMVQFIKSRNEKNIAIISHSSFIGQFMDKHIRYMENGDKELKYCHPYKFTLSPDYTRN